MSAVVTAPAAWIRGELLPVVFGITPGAATKYRLRGIWTEGRHCKKDPVGRWVYNVEAITIWLGS